MCKNVEWPETLTAYLKSNALSICEDVVKETSTCTKKQGYIYWQPQQVTARNVLLGSELEEHPCKLLLKRSGISTNSLPERCSSTTHSSWHPCPIVWMPGSPSICC